MLLFDIKNVYIDQSIEFLARVVENTVTSLHDSPTTTMESIDQSMIGVNIRALSGQQWGQYELRELIGMGETVQRMLTPVMDLYESGSPARIAQTRALDDELDKVQAEIKLYLAEVARKRLDPTDVQRCFELTGHAISLEHVGDIIVKDLLSLAEKKRDRRLRFTPDGWRELTDLHQRVLANLHLTLNLLVSGDRETARQIVEEKTVCGSWNAIAAPAIWRVCARAASTPLSRARSTWRRSGTTSRLTLLWRRLPIRSCAKAANCSTAGSPRRLPNDV